MRKAATTRRGQDEGKQAVAFGRAVYLLRIKASLSQEELAFRSGIGRSYVGVLERGEKEPCLGVMYRLAKALNSSLLDVCGLAEQLYKEGYRPAPRNARVR
jgi:XRE family transcriptional regulator, regulator of sulfur utilization